VDRPAEARRNADDGDRRDDADDGLSPLGSQIPRRNEEFKSHPYLSVLSSRDEMHEWLQQMQGVADAKEAEPKLHAIPCP